MEELFICGIHVTFLIPGLSSQERYKHVQVRDSL